MDGWQGFLVRKYLPATLDRAFHGGTPSWRLPRSTERQQRADNLPATSPFVFLIPWIPLSTWQNYMGDSVPGRWGLCAEFPATLDTGWDRPLNLESVFSCYYIDTEWIWTFFHLISDIFQELMDNSSEEIIALLRNKHNRKQHFQKCLHLIDFIPDTRTSGVKNDLFESTLTSHSQISSQQWACQQPLIFSALSLLLLVTFGFLLLPAHIFPPKI